jgi:hypothetical protein
VNAPTAVCYAVAGLALLAFAVQIVACLYFLFFSGYVRLPAVLWVGMSLLWRGLTGLLWVPWRLLSGLLWRFTPTVLVGA